MKCICINLHSNKPRRLFMKEQFKKHKINCDFFKALDGRNMTVDNFLEKDYISKKIYDDFKSKKIGIHKPSFACAFSHIQVWKDFLENDEEYLLVFEDDFSIRDNFNKRLNEYMENTPKDWDFLYFDYNRFVGKQINKYWGKPTNNAGKGKNAFLSCYVINKSGCKKLLDLMNPYVENKCIDSIMRQNFDKFNAYFANTKLGFQNGRFKSDRV